MEKAAGLARAQEIQRRRFELERKRKALRAQVAALEANFEADALELTRMIEAEQCRETRLVEDQSEMARSRKADRERQRLRQPSDGE